MRSRSKIYLYAFLWVVIVFDTLILMAVGLLRVDLTTYKWMTYLIGGSYFIALLSGMNLLVFGELSQSSRRTLAPLWILIQCLIVAVVFTVVLRESGP